MMSAHLAAQAADNLRRWREAGEPHRWVQERDGRWDHAAWEALQASLQQSEYWPVDPAAVGRLVEELRQQRANLKRWLDSGQARHWVAQHGGRWQHRDWQALLEQLRYSEYWPLDPAALGAALQRIAVEVRNLQRWQATGDPRRWVEERHTTWDHADFQRLIETLRRSPFWPLDLGEVGRTLEELQRCYWNVYRWRDAGEARRRVQAHGGKLDHAARLELLDELTRSEYWPMDPVTLERVLAEIEQEADNLRRWQESGAALAWVEQRRGQWSRSEWQTLVQQLQRSEFWPLDLGALTQRVQAIRQEWWNLDRWKVSGLARRWVEAHQGEWTAADWHGLLEDLRVYRFWPIDVGALARALEEVRTDWWRLRPWLKRGQALRSAEPRLARAEVRAVLDSLQRLDGWPLGGGETLARPPEAPLPRQAA
jgi:hypothetical protein